MRKFVATLLLLLVTSSVFAQVEINLENRMENRAPGYCGWTCVETLGRHQKIEALYNLLDNRAKEFTWEWDGQEWKKSPYVWVDYGSYKAKVHRSPASHMALANKLKSLKVKYHYQSSGEYDKTLIQEAIRANKGCMVVVRWWKDDKGNALVTDSNTDTHAIIILDYNDRGIVFYDPNYPKNNYTASLNWFNYYWTGYTIVIDK